MPTIQDTAYPRFKTYIPSRDLSAIYSPTPDDLALARSVTRGKVTNLGFLILLKTFQRLGYFVTINQVPIAIVEHIAALTLNSSVVSDLVAYDPSKTRKRHMQTIRQNLNIHYYDKEARHIMLLAMRKAARTKEDLADIINIGIEELIRKRYELSAFDTLVRGARHVRSILYRQFYRQVDVLLSIEEKARLYTLFTPEPEANFSPWNQLKQEPGSPTLTHLKVWLDRQAWLSQYHIRQEILQDIPDAKIKYFAAEAKTLDAARMLEMESRKRLTLAASLLKLQSARVLDDLAEMLIKRMSVIHQRGKEALTAYHICNQQRTDELIQTLRNLVTAYRTDGTEPEKMAAMKILLPDGGDEVLQQCQDHMAYVGNNYFPFLWRFYRSHRAALFRLLRSITV